MPEEKCCKKCCKTKSLTEFGRQAASKDGVKNYCKMCISEMNKERYQRITEKHKRQVRDWQILNEDKVKKYKRKYLAKQRSSGVKRDTDGNQKTLGEEKG
jgi:hypothetical protein